MKLYVLVGMIASGKSTYARNAARQGLLCVNDDAIYTMLHGNDYSLYEKKLKPLYKTLENTAVTMALGMGRSIIVDRGLNTSPKSRRRWIALANSLDVPAEAIDFPLQSPEEHARRRFEFDSRGMPYEHWLQAAVRHREHYLSPSTTEGFAAVHLLTFVEILSGKVIR